MKYIFRFIAITCFSIILFACNSRSGKPRVLVFSKTTGYRHGSIAAGQQAIFKLAQENGFEVDTTENADYFTEDSLKNYSAVIFLNTTGNMLNGYQEADFERYIQAGGGFLGVHAAADGEYDWGWYNRLVGGYFESHPAQQIAKLDVVDQGNPATKHLPREWKRKDEWYNYKKLDSSLHVLIKLDEKSYNGGKNGDNHPIVWYHDFDGGRSFYCGLGHTDESYKEDNFLKLLLGGIQYAIGDNKKLNYGNAKTQRPPEEDRFTKTMLTQGTLFEPTEMTILPNFDVLIAQRRGEVMLYKASDKSIKQAGFLNVYWKTSVKGVNAEEGLLGMQADPDFEKNHFVYLFYSPIDTSVNRLSRFKFENDTLDPKSEKIILQFYSQREICCHTGGSIAFGPDHTLFLSAGDNSTPFDEPKQRFVNRGFGPLDDRPGHEQYDARRSSGNSNDLRGKIMRIKIRDDGSYDIPEGNLFPKGTANTRPEIYVMGNRNPYRISVDKKNGNLYWGEVGPDANNDSLDTRGPRGYDELNQARKAGFFGWPLFVGNNYPYRAYDYATGKSGEPFDAAKPVNNSRNNTGLQQLPPVSPAFIWYPYAESKDFPQVGTGGRNAMAGPVYYTDMWPKDTRYPDYFNGKLFIYDWIRGWIKLVTMKENGDFDKMESFMGSTKFSNPIDMELGPDGKLYILEYGSGWFAKNPDAGLSRIDFNAGNRPPKIADLKVDKTSGKLPFAIKASVEATDPEKDKLTYIWDLGGTKKETSEPTLNYTFDKPGDYNVSVQVVDDKKAASTSNVVAVYAGNEAPNVTIAVAGNKTFYFPGKPVDYSVLIEDRDDTSKTKDLSNLIVSADYMEGSDRAASSTGHQVLSEAMIGKNTMLSLDCKACHKIDEKSIGPSYTDVARKYQKDPNAVPYLVDKIIKGGSGVWGEAAMSAHPNLKESDARQIVTWIQSLANTGKAVKSLPATGSVDPTLKQPVKDRGVLYLSATYTDKGGNNIKPLSASYTVSLRNSKMSFGRVRNMGGYTKFSINGMNMMVVPKANGWFSIDDIDLTDITAATVGVGWQKAPQSGYNFELRLDSQDGKKLGEFEVKGGGESATEKKPSITSTINVKLEPVNDGKMHKLFIVSKPKDPKESEQMALSFIEFKTK
jgi:cytochrome c